MSGEGGISPTDRILQADLRTQQTEARFAQARQVTSKSAFAEEVEESSNPFSGDKQMERKAMKERPRELAREETTAQMHRVHDKENASDSADQRQEDNPELDATRLRELRRLMITRGGRQSAAETLSDVRSFFSDPSLADEAMEYLEQNLDGDAAKRAAEARALLNESDGRLVRAGRNMGPDSRSFAGEGLASAEALRNLYRDITGNPREGNALFKELAAMFPFDRLKMVIKFLLQSLGSDLRAKGPSIERGELYRLTTETRVLQSILGVYHFFKRRERLIRKLFAQKGLSMPEDLEFQALAEHYMDLVEERYPTSAKVLRLAKELAIEEEILAQLIVYEQYRDAIREVAPRIYRSMQHRYDLLMALIEALEELEDQLDEDEDEESHGDV